jgi:hypothetical protein
MWRGIAVLLVPGVLILPAQPIPEISIAAIRRASDYS